MMMASNTSRTMMNTQSGASTTAHEIGTPTNLATASSTTAAKRGLNTPPLL